jgi:hypothetical protein
MNNVIDLHTKNQIISKLDSVLKIFGDELKQTAQALRKNSCSSAPDFRNSSP